MQVSPRKYYLNYLVYSIPFFLFGSFTCHLKEGSMWAEDLWLSICWGSFIYWVFYWHWCHAYNYCQSQFERWLILALQVYTLICICNCTVITGCRKSYCHSFNMDTTSKVSQVYVSMIWTGAIFVVSDLFFSELSEQGTFWPFWPLFYLCFGLVFLSVFCHESIKSPS